MSPDSHAFIFLNAFLINNFVLAMFLGLCPFLGVSGKVKTAWNMGLAVIFVMIVSSICAFAINHLLVRFELEFLPLITTNCAILGLALFQTNREYDFTQCLAFSLGAGAGFTLALVLMAGLREKLELADVPDTVTQAALSLMIAGLLSLTFMGFAGLGG